MLETSLNIFDLGVFIIIGLSALLSFFRGFAREVISLGSWIGATVITLYAFPTVSKWIEPQVKSAMIAAGLASIGVFVIALITISIITSILIKFIKPSKEIGFIDNFVGLLFGAARGLLIVAIGYFIMTIVVAPKDYPIWVKEAYSRPYVATAAHYVAKLTPTYVAEAVGKAKESADEVEEHQSKLKKNTVTIINEIDDEELKAEAKRLHDTMKENAKDTGPDHSSNLPSFEDLQRRVRAENEKR